MRTVTLNLQRLERDVEFLRQKYGPENKNLQRFEALLAQVEKDIAMLGPLPESRVPAISVADEQNADLMRIIVIQNQRIH